MKTAYITLSPEGAALIPALEREFGEIDCFVYEAVAELAPRAESFTRIAELTGRIFGLYRGLIYAAPCGVVVRSIAACATSKYTDPAVVVMDAGARWAVSLLSGHEGGANDLALRVANLFDAEPVISTTTEAVKDIIVGVGCRRGAESDAIAGAIEAALAQLNLPLSRVRLLASAEVKRDEVGLLAAGEKLNLPLRFLSMEQLRHCAFAVTPSEFVEASVGVPAVAEPAALLAGRRTTLLLPKTIFNHITVAVARENFPL